ncbi:MAG: ABC transporter ATP-binding protein [OCS116 cluster bacterium]|nr:ABC transporter ATP-binding protein [OCS116 cluster bacterium]
MAEIRLKNLAHSYNPAHQTEQDYALKPLDLTWEDGKTYALLGPSGCGKTTMLNIISGLVKPSEGQLLFDGQDVTSAPTSKRNIAQVFQFPVIYNTMSVAQNLAFPLVCRKYSDKDIKFQVDKVADLLDLTEYLPMAAKKLTADQKQLISLGRGLVREDVNAILLDEPLTVIDPQMKFELRRKLREINKRSGITMVLVTHDQNEAMTFADEVVVMQDGRVMQSGTPEILFEQPQNTFVGYFIGSPPMNFLPLKNDNGILTCDHTGFSQKMDKLPSKDQYSLGIRPEYLKITEQQNASFGIAKIIQIDDIGIDGIITLSFEDGPHIKLKTRDHKSLHLNGIVGLSMPPNKSLIYQNNNLISSNI